MQFGSLLASAVLAAALGCCLSQYPRQLAPEPPPEQERPQPYHEAPSPRRNSVYNPAPVHYVNIGAELQGDYKFGYDTGKGDLGQSFREETRLPDGSVRGAYGYIDGSGRQRIVKYTAGKDGYKAEGDLAPEGAPKAAASPRPAPRAARPNPQPVYAEEPAYASPPQPAYRAPSYSSAPPPSRPVHRAPSYQPSSVPAEPAYRAPTHSSGPAPSQPAYRAPPHSPRPAAPRYAPRPAPVHDEYNQEDYDSPNDLSNPPVRVPIDTALFNYNIGTSSQSRA